MATQTPNLNLKKPAGTDYVQVGDFNENANILDAVIGDLSTLDTSVKTNLVLAINESLSSSSFPPYIGENKHWYVWNFALAQYEDSGIIAEGQDGADGTDGTNGTDGVDAYVHFKWSADEPDADEDMKDTPDAWIGIYSGASPAAPTDYTDYQWYQYKGEKGDTGDKGDQGDTGPQGPKGDAGKGLDILGTYSTLSALQAAVTDPAIGDMYNVEAPHRSTSTCGTVMRGKIKGSCKAPRVTRAKKAKPAKGKKRAKPAKREKRAKLAILDKMAQTVHRGRTKSRPAPILRYRVSLKAHLARQRKPWPVQIMPRPSKWVKSYLYLRNSLPYRPLARR